MATMEPTHPLLVEVATRYAQHQGRITRNLAMAREHLDAVPDGWAKVDGEWVQLEGPFKTLDVVLGEGAFADGALYFKKGPR